MNDSHCNSTVTDGPVMDGVESEDVLRARGVNGLRHNASRQLAPIRSEIETDWQSRGRRFDPVQLHHPYLKQRNEKPRPRGKCGRGDFVRMCPNCAWWAVLTPCSCPVWRVVPRRPRGRPARRWRTAGRSIRSCGRTTTSRPTGVEGWPGQAREGREWELAPVAMLRHPRLQPDEASLGIHLGPAQG
jgi:hypothetical protein